MINRGRFSLFARSDTKYSARTLDLVGRTTVIDMLGLLTLNYKKLVDWELDPQRFQAGDFQRLQRSGINIFHPAVGYNSGDIFRESSRDIQGWNTFVAAHPDRFQRVETVADFKLAKDSGKLGILIGQQNSSHFRAVEDVDRFYKLGQRVSQLTYRGNQLGGGSSDAGDRGLSEYGGQIVTRMNELGMAIDVSHCGDRTTLEAIEASKTPVLVTHSNCRALVPGAARCKTNEAIKKLAAKGGVMGMTMVRTFVRSTPRVTIQDVLDHVDHAVKLVGIEHVGMGSDVDLDGRDPITRPKKYDLDEMTYSTKVFDLAEGLVRRKYSDENIELILGGNFTRALGAIWTI